MPYKTNDDLPDAIKDALPAAAQTIFRNAFNGADGDDEAASKIGWTAVKNAGFKKDADGNWKKESTDKLHEIDAEVMSVGVWNGDKFTAEHLDQMVSNFDRLKASVKPPVKLGHNEQQLKDGNPALGWVTKLRRAGNKLIATLSQVPDILHRALKNGLYKRVSSEVYFNYEHNGKKLGRALAGVALLGADIPAVTDLKDLEAFLTQSTDKGSFERIAVFSFDTDNNHKIIQEGNMPDEYKTKYETELKAKEAAEAKVEKYEAELAEKEKAEQAKAKKDRTDSFKAFCEKMVKEFRMTPAGRDKVVNAIDKHVYSHEDGLSIPVDVFEKFVATYEKVIDPKEEGAGNGGDKNTYTDVHQEMNARVQKYMEDHTDTEYSAAMTKVLESDEELAGRYIDAINFGGGDE